MFEDKILTCRECGIEFPFTASEQQFYADQGYANEPRRCRECRAKRNANRTDGARPARTDRQYFDVICDQCGKPTQVPFQPNGSKPVYCRECYNQMNPRRDRY